MVEKYSTIIENKIQSVLNYRKICPANTPIKASPIKKKENWSWKVPAWADPRRGGRLCRHFVVRTKSFKKNLGMKF